METTKQRATQRIALRPDVENQFGDYRFLYRCSERDTPTEEQMKPDSTSSPDVTTRYVLERNDGSSRTITQEEAMQWTWNSIDWQESPVQVPTGGY